MRTKPILISIAAALLLFFIVLSIRGSLNGKIILTIVPKIATVSIDGNASFTPATITTKMSLKKGSHKVVVSSPGFATQTNDFTVKNGSASQVTIALEAQTATAIKYYLNNPAEEAILEGVSGSKGSTINTSQTKNYPLISELPFVARTWRVDYGQSVKHPADQNSIAITITYGNEEGKHLALDWITSQGYDPAAYEIIYKSFTQ